MFSQFGPAPAQRMDQGGGEYTGFIPEVYEGDDTYIPISRTMAERDAAANKLAIQQRTLARRKEELEAAANKADAATITPITPPTELSVLTGKPPVTVHAQDGSTPYVQRDPTPTIAEAVVTPSATSTGASWLPLEGIAKKAGNLIPEPYWDAGFGIYDKIMADVKRDFDQGGGALDPTSQNNYLQQLIKAGANDETIARLMDKFMPAAKTAAAAIPNLQNNEWLATQFDEYMPKIKGAGNEIVQFARDQGNLYSNFYGPMWDKFQTTLGTWAIPSNMPNPVPTDAGHAGPFNPQHMELRAGQFEDFTGEAHNAVANPLMGNSVIIPQDQSWSGGVMDQQLNQGQGLDAPGWLETSPLGRTLKSQFGSGETSDIVDSYYKDQGEGPMKRAGETLSSLSDTVKSGIDWGVDHARGAGGTLAAAWGLNKAYDLTEMGQLKQKLKKAPDVSQHGEMNKGMIQREIDRRKANKWNRWKDKLPKGMKGINKAKMLGLTAAAVGLFSVADFVLAAGGDEDVATDWAMDFLDQHPEFMVGVDIGTDPVGAALSGSEVLSKRMGPASENYWATPGIGSAAGGTADPTWMRQ